MNANEANNDPTEPWRGVGVALVTLFDDSGAVDYAATAALAATLVDLGVAAVLVAGTTGEAEALTDDERVRLVEAVRQELPGTPLIAGASGPYAQVAAERAAAVRKAGADQVLVAPPRVCGDVAGFFATVAASADGAVLGYHNPPLGGPGVPVDLLPALPVAGIKDSSGDPERLVHTLQSWNGSVYVGAAMLLTMAGAVGGAGAILAVANTAPELAIAAFAGDGGAQVRLLDAHLRAKASFPHGIKAVVAERFGTSTATRLG